jgi:hypothetical protein
MKRLFICLVLLVGIPLALAAQDRNAPLRMGRPGDRDDSVRLIEGPRVLNLTSHSATIEWKTSGNGANHVRYGTAPERPDKSKYIPGGSREHQMTLTGLQPNTTYYFDIMERDGEVRRGGTGSLPTPGNGADEHEHSRWGERR